MSGVYRVDLPGAGAIHVELPYPLGGAQAAEAVTQLRELADALESNFHLLDQEPSSQRQELLRACERLRRSEQSEAPWDLNAARVRLADYEVFRDFVADYLRLHTD